jgi:hypothetical protein
MRFKYSSYCLHVLKPGVKHMSLFCEAPLSSVVKSKWKPRNSHKYSLNILFFIVFVHTYIVSARNWWVLLSVFHIWTERCIRDYKLCWVGMSKKFKIAHISHKAEGQHTKWALNSDPNDDCEFRVDSYLKYNMTSHEISMTKEHKKLLNNVHMYTYR